MDSTFGIGIIQGQHIGDEFLKQRDMHQKGPLSIDDKIFQAASGKPGRFWGAPYGTFILTPQATASTILRLYKRFHLHGKGFDTVWNVGLPGNITGVGYDPAAKRRRGSIQIHCDPKMISMGCIVMNKEDFLEFAGIAKEKDNLALEVAPDNGGVTYKVIKRA